MPFDTTQTSVVERLGIIPVPDDVLQQHKRDVVANYQSKFRDARWYEFYQYDTGYPIPQGNGHGKAPSKFDPIQQVERCLDALSQRGIQRIVEAPSSNTTPSEVVNVVETAERRAKEAGIETERVAGFFYTDPYVSLVYRENGVVQKTCLAIWDGQTVLHLAKLI